jgi:hypothetical protein
LVGLEDKLQRFKNGTIKVSIMDPNGKKMFNRIFSLSDKSSFVSFFLVLQKYGVDTNEISSRAKNEIY